MESFDNLSGQPFCIAFNSPSGTKKNNKIQNSDKVCVFFISQNSCEFVYTGMI